ncbi:MAG: hypothetical protein HY937_05265 [Nitrosomonadales bacterium]|nr:hypothetical protein [Nitrosomonadales bacterium]
MSQHKEQAMRFLFMACLLALLPPVAAATEPANNTQPSSVIDMTLPIHQQKKLHPEFSDPVLGDQAQIVEWAWSPQYAKRFNLPVQPDGLKDGGLWLIGVKVQRIQSQQWQRYTCNIVGLMDNKLPIIAPPGEIYTVPAYGWQGGMPGLNMALVVKEFTPAQETWNKKPKNELERTRPERSIGLNYLSYYRQFQAGLAYFEIEGGCGYFNDPQLFRNEIRFPTKFIHENRTAVFEPDAIHFDLPDSLMQKMYPYIREAEDWTSCLMRRSGRIGMTLTLRSIKTKRFGNTCEPVTKQSK